MFLFHQIRGSIFISDNTKLPIKKKKGAQRASCTVWCGGARPKTANQTAKLFSQILWALAQRIGFGGS
jgi:hypothetical protein